MRLDRALSIGDLRQLARRRLPRIVFDVIESGVEDEHGVARNTDAFREYCLLPRHLIDVSNSNQATTLLGRTYDSPFGLGPTGFAGLIRRGIDQMEAEVAAEMNVPFVLSGASVALMEDVAAIAPQHAWYHLYPAKTPEITKDLLKRAEDAGFENLVLTVDNPVYPKRERDTRNGFSHPPKMPLSIMLEALLHPGWLHEYFSNGGMPGLENWRRYASPGATGLDVANFFRTQSPAVVTWKDLEALRARWPGKLILKGVQHPDDARMAADLGVDAIVVSNHGGKAFDRSPSSLYVLPLIRSAVGRRVPIILDSGIRRGSDILVARCLGADFVFIGRAQLYGAAAGGKEGVRKVIEILRQEISVNLALVGCPDFADLNSRFLVPAHHNVTLPPEHALTGSNVIQHDARRVHERHTA